MLIQLIAGLFLDAYFPIREVLGYHPGLAFTIGEQANSQQLLSRDWRAFARECGFGYPLVRRR